MRLGLGHVCHYPHPNLFHGVETRSYLKYIGPFRYKPFLSPSSFELPETIRELISFVVCVVGEGCGWGMRIEKDSGEVRIRREDRVKNGRHGEKVSR